MNLSDYDYHLPPELIAQAPSERRDASRLLLLDRARQQRSDCHFTDLPELLNAGDLLVFNDTQVLKARLFGRKASGGKVEVMVDRVLAADQLLAHVRASKSPKTGSVLLVEEVTLHVLGREDNLFRLSSDGYPVLDLLARHGQMPLPPYIRREADEADNDRYQTVYAKNPGAVAAPTAGLHFGRHMLERLKAAEVGLGYLTLHVGSGTFQPVRVSQIEDHTMHSEWFEIGETLVEQIAQTRAAGGRIYAVGTTSARALESAWTEGAVQPYTGDTDIFIYPGVEVRAIDGLITNFHLPQSTLLMLVSAMAGRDTILAAYEHAVAQRYRFFSYGDAMFIR